MFKLKLKLKFKSFDIPGFPDYSLHRYGDNDFRVWSKPRVDALGHKRRGKYLRSYLQKKGYLTFSLSNNGVEQFSSIHRIVCLAFHPNLEKKAEVDHIDREKLNNRPENLRWATRTEQLDNRGMYSNNTSGTTGVSWDTAKEKWDVRLTIDGRARYFGLYESFNDAIAKLEKVKSQN